MDDLSAGREKRALENGEDRYTSPRALSNHETICSRLIDVQVGLPASNDSLSGVGRVPGVAKSRRLNADQKDSRDDQFATKHTLPYNSVSPSLRVFTNDSDAARSPSHTSKTSFVSNSFELTNAAKGLERPVFVLGKAPPHVEPIVVTPLHAPGFALENKTSPSGHFRRLSGEVATRTGETDVSSKGKQELEGSDVQSRRIRENALGARAIPTISHLFRPFGNANTFESTLGLLDTPYQLPAVASTIMSSFKQKAKKQRASFSLQRNFETTKGCRSLVSENAVEMMNMSNTSIGSFVSCDLSSDEELIAIPDPDLELSFSQEKLEDFSLSESSMDETVVLTLCEGLATSLTNAERDRMESLNLFTIALAQHPSPIVLCREQFKFVFGESIRGVSLSLLSRRHCLIHVESVPSRSDGTKTGIMVRIENTSTNGSWVNDTQLINGETHKLELGDIVTLLKICHDEADVSLKYELVRPGTLPDHSSSSRKKRKSRHDGRYVRPSNKFSCELAALSNRCGMSPVQEPGMASFQNLPAQAIAQDMHHHIAGNYSDAAEALVTDEEKTSSVELVQRTSMLSRRIQCMVLFADQSVRDFFGSRPTIEEAYLDYREELLSEVLSPFASTRALDASSYQWATAESIKESVHDSSDVLFYTGGGDEDHLVIEAPNGLSTRLEKDEVFQILSDVKSTMGKLIVVISPSRKTACLLARCGAPHVIYISSATKNYWRVTAFIRALFASLLKGFSVETSYTNAEYVALNDLLPIMRSWNHFCEMLPISEHHLAQIGSVQIEAMATDFNATVLLNGSFIPVLTRHFLGRDAVIKQVKAALEDKFRVCNIYGNRGVGKSSIAVHIARTSYRTRCYRNGVHYFAVAKMAEFMQNGTDAAVKGFQSQDCLLSKQSENALLNVKREIETLLRSLPATDPTKYPTMLVVLDGCDVVLPAFEVFVRHIVRAFAGVQILITSTERVRINTDADEVQAIRIEELGKMDSAKLFLKHASCHLTSRQFRQYIPDSSIEGITRNEGLLSTKGNPLCISRLVFDLESMTASD